MPTPSLNWPYLTRSYSSKYIVDAPLRSFQCRRILLERRQLLLLEIEPERIARTRRKITLWLLFLVRDSPFKHELRHRFWMIKTWGKESRLVGLFPPSFRRNWIVSRIQLHLAVHFGLDRTGPQNLARAHLSCRGNECRLMTNGKHGRRSVNQGHGWIYSCVRSIFSTNGKLCIFVPVLVWKKATVFLPNNNMKCNDMYFGFFCSWVL